MKRTAAFFLAVILLAALLTGCGRSVSQSSGYTTSQAPGNSSSFYAAAEEAYFDEPAAGDYDYEYEYDSYDLAYADVGTSLSYAPAPSPSETQKSAAADEPESAAQTQQKLIYTADLDMETLEFDEATAALAELTAEVGGYYESSALNDQGSYRWASYTVRVPAEQYRTFLDRTGELCHVLSLQEYTEDVSEYYYDTAGRLDTQRSKLSRLQELMDEAENMEDIIVLEDAISSTEETIDRLSGTLRHYDALVSYSTVDIYLKEVLVYEPAPNPTYGTRLGEAFTDGLQGFVEGLGDILIALAYSWLWLLLIAAIIVLVLWLTRKFRAARRQKRAERRALRAAKKAAAAQVTSPALSEDPAPEAEHREE